MKYLTCVRHICFGKARSVKETHLSLVRSRHSVLYLFIYLFDCLIYLFSLSVFIYISLWDKMKCFVLRFCLLSLVIPELLAVFGHLSFFGLLI